MVVIGYPFSVRQVTSTTLFLVIFGSGLFLSGLALPLLLVGLASVAAAGVYSMLAYRRKEPLAGSLVLVTGCSSGMGLELAKHLTSVGVHVAAGVRRREDAEAVVRECGIHSKLLHPILLDVTKPEDIKRAEREVRELLQRRGNQNLVFHGLVNNAGYPETGPVESIPMDRARYQFEVNLFGPMELTNAFLPLIREHKARVPRGYTPRVVMVSSVVGKFTLPLLGVYCASKHALEALGDAYRRELSAWGIDVCLVQPGATMTRFVPKFGENLEHNLQEGEVEPSSPVSRTYDRAGKRLMSAAGTTFYGAPSVVVDRIQSALYDSAPYPRYTVGLDCDATLTVAKHLPDVLLDKVFQFACGTLPGSAEKIEVVPVENKH